MQTWIQKHGMSHDVCVCVCVCAFKVRMHTYIHKIYRCRHADTIMANDSWWWWCMCAFKNDSINVDTYMHVLGYVAWYSFAMTACECTRQTDSPSEYCYSCGVYVTYARLVYVTRTYTRMYVIRVYVCNVCDFLRADSHSYAKQRAMEVPCV